MFFFPGNFECGNPEKLKSKCIPVAEAQEYVAVSRVAPTAGRAWCFGVDFQTLRLLFFPFLFCLVFVLVWFLCVCGFGFFAFLPSLPPPFFFFALAECYATLR